MNNEYDQTANSLFDSLLGKSYEVESKEEDAKVYYAPPKDGDIEELPLFEEEDRDILMHRDAHFSGNFQLMLEQYEDDGIGAVLDVEADRIERLQKLEEQLGRDLAPFLLQGADAEQVAKAKRLYQALGEVIQNPKSAPIAKAIAELIVGEEAPVKRAQEAARMGAKIVGLLIELIESPLFYDPLLPGFGQAPQVASLALGKLKAESAIKPLFQLIGNENFDVESAALSALSQIGAPAVNFCLKQLEARPLSKNNERASVLASSLAKDNDFFELILKQLEDPQVQKNERLATYLVLACSDLPKSFHVRLKEIAKHLPEVLQQEVQLIAK